MLDHLSKIILLKLIGIDIKISFFRTLLKISLILPTIEAYLITHSNKCISDVQSLILHSMEGNKSTQI